jgi:hypothetical protein
VSLTDRDRKIVMLLVPLVLIAAYWFVLLAPQREQAAEAAAALATQEERRDLAQQRVDSLSADRSNFAEDYAELVRLGKAVPETVDMPTVLVQLEAAAGGTDIEFRSIVAQERTAAIPVAPAPAAPGSGDGSQPAAAGGAPAQSAPGTAAESAGNAVGGANASSTAAAEQSGVAPGDTQTSETAREGGLPVGGGVATTAAPAAGGVVGLDTVPLEMEFVGDFFNLATFFHQVKRYVESSDRGIAVRGRLLTIDGIDFESDPDRFPKITATLKATVYLAPASEGATAGATPSGPSVTPASDGTSPTPVAPVTPTATATR